MTNFRFPLAVAAVALGATAALAQPVPTRPPAHDAHAAKVQLRTDVADRVARRFARVDANRDGFVTAAEGQAAFAQRAAKRAQRIADRGAKRAERRDPARAFARMDADRDGKLTRAEVDAARAARANHRGGALAQAGPGRADLFERADTNRDQIITLAEFSAMPRRQHPGLRRMHATWAGGRLFGLADLDKDGRVSLAEAQSAALQRFDRADVNRDGQVTREERSQMRQQMRIQHRG